MKKLGILALTVIASVTTYEFLKRRGYLDALLGEETYDEEYWFDDADDRVRDALRVGRDKAKAYYDDAHDAIDEFLDDYN